MRAERTPLRPWLLAVAVVAVLAACGSEPADPAEARRDRVRDRLESTFSRQQSDCILEQLDDDQLEVLDPRIEASDEPGGDLDDPEVLEAYSNAAVACVAGFNATG
jgi:hypothetical protein